jgi:hypothetical protein
MTEEADKEEIKEEPDKDELEAEKEEIKEETHELEDFEQEDTEEEEVEKDSQDSWTIFGEYGVESIVTIESTSTSAIKSWLVINSKLSILGSFNYWSHGNET